MTCSPDGFDSQNGVPPPVEPPKPPPAPPDSLASVTGTEFIPFRERLQKYRQYRKISISELARRAGLAKSFVSMLEAGKRVPGRKAAWRLAGALAVPPDEILLFVNYAHLAKETERPQDGKTIPVHEYINARGLDMLFGGASLVETGFWAPNWLQKRMKAFTGLRPAP